MCFFFSLIPATVWVIIGFFVLFASTKAEGGLRKFGQVLAIWSFVIATLFPLFVSVDRFEEVRIAAKLQYAWNASVIK